MKHQIALSFCVVHQLLCLEVTASSSESTIRRHCGSVCHKRTTADQAKGPLSVAEGGPLFLQMIDVPSDKAGGVLGHGGLACVDGSDHGSLQLTLLGGDLGAGFASSGVEGVFGGAFSGLELADGGESHGCVVWWGRPLAH